MIIDNDSNIVYFSALLESDPRFPGAYKRIAEILDRNHVKYDLLECTRDVWARDYMPVQISKNEFVQFRYNPSYLIDEPERRSEPLIVCRANNINPAYSEINLDGGNVIRWHDKVIMTNRLYTENPEFTNKKELVEEIGRQLKSDIIIIPQINSDFTGHSDGLVRFYNENTIIGNDRKEEYEYWVKSTTKVIDTFNLKYIDMPMFEYKDKRCHGSSIGCYMNWLEIGNLIVFPVFEVPGNKDKLALDLIMSLYPGKIIEPININDIANQGGLMNCISWNIKN